MILIHFHHAKHRQYFQPAVIVSIDTSINIHEAEGIYI